MNPAQEYINAEAAAGRLPAHMSTTTTVHTYTRSVGEDEQQIRVNVGADGRVRMTYESLHHLLTAVGFQPTEPKENH